MGMPVALFEGGEQPLFDLGCDMTVDLDQAVGQVMSQPPGLRYLGDMIGD